MSITLLYAALLGLLFVTLSIRTLRLRRQFKVSLGGGEEPVLMRAIRVHSNLILIGRSIHLFHLPV